MSPVKTPKPPKAGDFNDEFITKTVKMRGKRYVLRELSVEKYDEIVAQATSENDNGETLIDNTLLRKLLTLESLREPRLPSLGTLPLRLSTKLQNVAAEINYGNEPEEEDKEEGKPDVEIGEPDDDEGEG